MRQARVSGRPSTVPCSSSASPRAYGIGTSLTTLYGGHEEELRELLGLPPDALTMALIPMGYPAKGRWAQPRRRPVEEVVHWDRWGAKRSRPE